MFVLGLILFIASIVILIYCSKKYFHYKVANLEIELENTIRLEEKRQNTETCLKLEEDLRKLSKQYEDETKKIQNLHKLSAELIDTAKSSYEKYCETLENEYKQKEKEYETIGNSIAKAYDDLQEHFMKQLEETKKELDKMRATHAAAIEAQIKEKEIEENTDFYCLKISNDELADIHTLERVKPKLNQPRILCMLIWSTYFQKPMTSLCNNVLGTEDTCGIYKITNQLNKMCYVGQSVDVAKRWKDHAKCGLGIDTPANNKLYKAMQEEGLENFSWELLEQCKKEELNEKEKFYIGLYQSDKYGYNSNKRCWLKHRLLFFIKKYNII